MKNKFINEERVFRAILELNTEIAKKFDSELLFTLESGGENSAVKFANAVILTNEDTDVWEDFTDDNLTAFLLDAATTYVAELFSIWPTEVFEKLLKNHNSNNDD